MQTLIEQALAQPADAIAYAVSTQLAALYPDRDILEGEDYFPLEHYAAKGHCQLVLKPATHLQTIATWDTNAQVYYNIANGWYQVTWQGQDLEVLWMQWNRACGARPYYWIIAETRAIAEKLVLEVYRWSQPVEEEILVFETGGWHRSEELYQSIKNASFDNLVLADTLKQTIRSDIQQFLAGEALYNQYGIPWKRGLLLFGPPGNGKTHTIKALINATGIPCLYVKSFTYDDYSSGTFWGIRTVFKRARETTPCFLVMEDLDSLITDENRSFFLNELDGFAANRGIIVVASSNHPERLDPAIVNRPSRFDRKYYFNLPELKERFTYIQLWNQSVQPELKLVDQEIQAIADATADFSFAYLKELLLSGMMTWFEYHRDQPFATTLLEQAQVLRSQMTTLTEPATNGTPALN